MKTKIITLSTIILAYVLCASVVLASAHAKDLAKHGSGDYIASTGKPTDINAKALSDLHNHTDKTMLKSFAKAVSDTGMRARERELKADVSRIEKTLLNHLSEALLFWRLAISLRI